MLVGHEALAVHQVSTGQKALEKALAVRQAWGVKAAEGEDPLIQVPRTQASSVCQAVAVAVVEEVEEVLSKIQVSQALRVVEVGAVRHSQTLA